MSSFKSMRGATEFLQTVRIRESLLIDALFEDAQVPPFFRQTQRH